MSNAPKRIFLSAVTADFESERRLLAESIGSNSYAVDWQGAFSQGPLTTLEKLDDLIRIADAVVHLVGPECGSNPMPPEVQALLSRYPSFLERFAGVLSSTDVDGLSLTHWEGFLALYHGKPCFLFRRGELTEFEREAAPQEARTPRDRQHRHWQRVKALGKDRGVFSDGNRLVIEVFRAFVDGRILPADAPGPSADVDWAAEIADPGDRLSAYLADREQPFGVFRGMITGQGDGKRILLVQAKRGHSKTRLLRTLRDYAALCRIPSCLVELEGVTLGVVLLQILEALEVPVASDNRLWPQISEILRSRRRPLVLEFDDFDKASREVVGWVRESLLANLDRYPAVVIVIAGITIPTASPWDRWSAWRIAMELPPILDSLYWERHYSARGLDLIEEDREWLRNAVSVSSGVPIAIDMLVTEVLLARKQGKDQ
jgi:hypothetical protein